MRLAPKKPIETFRDDFTYTNSKEAIARFPFPFPDDKYRYSVNIEPHQPKDGEGSAFEYFFDVDEHYLSEMAERALVLEQRPRSCLMLPHMDLACWDLIDMAMHSLSKQYPEYFSLQKEGDQWHWHNTLLDIKDDFTFGDSSTLPLPPLEYIGRQIQGDFALMDQRDNNLYMDAGLITCPADWSLAFNVGMSFSEWHGPVPFVHSQGIIERALKFLLAIPQGQPTRRLNWTLSINARMDTSPETYPSWGIDRTTVTPENVGEKVYLRVEVQIFDRMPRTNALMMNIRTYLISMDELATNPEWARRMYHTMKTLPAELIEYKGLTRFHPMLVEWLSAYK
ncbi:MAG: heme-dependent oxidative N-demethylase family protein [Marinomonadaceae bacterium]